MPTRPTPFSSITTSFAYRLAGGGFYDWDVLTGDQQHGIDYAIELDRTMTLGYLAPRREEQIAQEFCDQLSEGDNAASPCAPR